MVACAGFKAYLPAFWSLPSLFLTEAAAAGSIGLINSVGNLGGFIGPFVLGNVEKLTGSFMGGLFFLATCMALSSLTVFWLGRRDRGRLRPGSRRRPARRSAREAGQGGRLERRPGAARRMTRRASPDRARPRPRC